jgi:hypothetical protein
MAFLRGLRSAISLLVCLALGVAASGAHAARAAEEEKKSISLNPDETDVSIGSKETDAVLAEMDKVSAKADAKSDDDSLKPLDTEAMSQAINDAAGTLSMNGSRPPKCLANSSPATSGLGPTSLGENTEKKPLFEPSSEVDELPMERTKEVMINGRRKTITQRRESSGGGDPQLTDKKLPEDLRELVRKFSDTHPINPGIFGSICPNFARLDARGKQDAWIALVESIISPESAFKPGTSFPEPTLGYNSVGLMQMSARDAACKSVGVRSEGELKFMRPNLACGLREIEMLIDEHPRRPLVQLSGGYGSLGKYWSTTRPTNASGFATFKGEFYKRTSIGGQNICNPDGRPDWVPSGHRGSLN